MGMLDWFTKSKEARKKAEEEKEAQEREARANRGQAEYEHQKGKPGSDAWVALNE